MRAFREQIAAETEWDKPVHKQLGQHRAARCREQRHVVAESPDSAQDTPRIATSMAFRAGILGHTMQLVNADKIYAACCVMPLKKREKNDYDEGWLGS